MSLFNRKRRDEDSDHVRLTSPDHSWWTGEEPPPPPQDESTMPTSPGGFDDQDQPPPPVGAGPGELEDDLYLDDVPTDGNDLMSGIADALSDYAYSAEAGLDHVDDGSGEPAGGFGMTVDGFGSDWVSPGSDDDLAPEEVERMLFVRDGLPVEDRLTELLGALGLEGDADWVDIARSHRRLVTSGTGGRPDWEHDRQRRSANEAYACLRLFHH